MGSTFSYFLILNFILKHEYVTAKFHFCIRIIVISLFFLSVNDVL